MYALDLYGIRNSLFYSVDCVVLVRMGGISVLRRERLQNHQDLWEEANTVAGTVDGGSGVTCHQFQFYLPATQCTYSLYETFNRVFTALL